MRHLTSNTSQTLRTRRFSTLAVPTVLAATMLLLSATVQAQTFPGTPPTDMGTPPSGGTPPTGATPGDMGSGGTGSTVSLDGSNLTISLLYPHVDSVLASTSVTVSDAVEVDCANAAGSALCASTSALGEGLLDGETIDVSGTTLSVQLLAPFTNDDGVTFNGISFSDLSLGTGYTITGFTLTTNISGLSSSNVSFAASSVSVNLLGIDPSATTDGTQVGSFQIALQVSAVPEPDSVVLMALGLLSVAAVRAQRRKA